MQSAHFNLTILQVRAEFSVVAGFFFAIKKCVCSAFSCSFSLLYFNLDLLLLWLLVQRFLRNFVNSLWSCDMLSLNYILLQWPENILCETPKNASSAIKFQSDVQNKSKWECSQASSLSTKHVANFDYIFFLKNSKMNLLP